MKPKVLVIVRGGVPEIVADKEVDVLLLDYDNDPEGVIPEEYLRLLKQENESAPSGPS